MKNQNHFWALQATIPNGEKLLCWREKKHFYFGHGLIEQVPPPTLFNTKKEANKAWDKVPSKGGNLKQFNEVIKAKKVKIVKVKLSV